MAARFGIFDNSSAAPLQDGARQLLDEASQWARMALTLRDIADRIAPHTESIEATQAASTVQI